ncbi:MAG: NAD-binding protein, partial [Clostridia bacterium]|nr:NAD-binding protein [Clostridia bacterium]
LAGLSVKEMMIKFRPDILVCTVERGDEAFIPNGDFVFQGKDVVSIIATTKSANEFFQKIHYKGHSIKDVIVAGGTPITHYLCEILEKSGISLKIVEQDQKICEEFASQWEKLSVINGKSTEKELLLQEGVERTGAFVALSKNDEENILLSLFAKEAGAQKIITKINRTDYDSVISRLDLDTVVCPKNLTADGILPFVRAMKNSRGSNMQTLYNIIEDKVEAAEFIVGEGSPIIGTPLSELKFKPNVLVASIVRGKQAFIPRGHDTIQAGDAVVLVTKGLPLENVADVLN